MYKRQGAFHGKFQLSGSKGIGMVGFGGLHIQQFEVVMRIQDCLLYTSDRHLLLHRDAGCRSTTGTIKSIYCQDVYKRQLVIRVDNARIDIPPISGDFTFFGGIYRDAWLSLIHI